MATGVNQPFPNISTPLVDENNNITPAWRLFLLALWQRTGASAGGGGGGVGNVGTGGVLAWAGALPATLPTGYLLCDGSAVDRGAFSGLFAVIGTTWGIGDGSTTFNIPDLRNVFLQGVGTHALGSTGGSANVTLTTTQLPSHTHTVTDPGHIHAVADPGHTHTVTDPGHVHVLTDPGHTHTLTDPGHVHASLVASSTNTAGAAVGATTTGNTASATTGITLASNVTGLTLAAHVTGITNVSNVTGLTVTSHTTGITLANAGTGSAFSVLNPFAAVNWIIKT